MLVPSSQVTQIHMLDSALLKSLSVAGLYGVGLGFEDLDGGWVSVCVGGGCHMT